MTSQTSPSGQSIAKNTSLLTAAYILQKIFAFVYFTLIARWIGPEDVGKYVFAVSLTTLLAIFIDLGMTPVLIRETSKFKEKGSLYLGNIITLKIILGIFAYILAIILVNLLHKDPITIQMVSVTGLVMIIDSFTLSFFGIFRAHQTLKYEAFSIIFNQAFILIIGLIGLYLKFPLTVLAWALFGGSLISFIYSLLLLYHKKLASIRLAFSGQIIRSLIIIALPFALAGIFTRIYSYVDQLMISVLIGNKELGWYSVAYKITFALQFIPSAFAAAIYPAMSNYFEHAPEKLTQLFEKSMFFLMILSVPLAAGTLVISPKLIQVFYGVRFINSVLPLQILIVALPAIFLSFPVGSVLNSTNRQKINTINLGITMLINIALNIFLIPRYHHIGAALAATVSLYYLFLGNYYFVLKAIKVNYLLLIKKLLLIIVSSFIMALVAFYSLQVTNLAIAILLALLIFIILIFALKVIAMEDLNFIFRSILKKSAPQPEEQNI